MLNSHVKFHAANGRRLVLVADDEAVNRELLGLALEQDYEVIYAADGQEALDQIRRYREDLSLVLLDLMMPQKPGLEVLREMKADPELRYLPVIVVTADQNAEVESLSIGAIDYIPKPYPQAQIILARVLRAIELSEDREIIQSTERDQLTGLYNREYFYRYAEQYDQHHRDRAMDALVIDVNHFHMINERFGATYGDELLRRIGENIRGAVAASDGIVCRREADTFMIYCPHGLDYRAVLEAAGEGLDLDEASGSRVRLRMGVYANVDRSLEIERRFDRAYTASQTVKNNLAKAIGTYDETMHERELYAEQLLDDFQRALDEEQFLVYYQPKFDIRPKAPALYSAEALVRWQHPTLGLISPGVFIPLFEDNGLIQELDRYVWARTARQIRDWTDRLGFAVPVSVNVSRIDVYDPDLISRLEAILRDNNLEPSALLLELTESAYTQESDQIIQTAARLRDLGFQIEMDDFGTGYSSLNMISALPIDALKLDMQFVRSAFQEQKDTRMLEVIIDIADHLHVPVIAEGVETREQMLALKGLGCDIVQGYYFSKPVPAPAFEPFLTARKELSPTDLDPEIVKPDLDLTQEPVEITVKPRRAVRLKAINYVFVTLALLLAGAVGLFQVLMDRAYTRMDESMDQYYAALQAASDLQIGSDYLTMSVRTFAGTGNLRYLNDYFEEANVTRRRDLAVETMEALLGGSHSQAYASLEEALATSNELMELEYRSMRLTQLSRGYADSQVPPEVSGVVLTPAQLALSPQAQQQAAVELVLGGDYAAYKDLIQANVQLCGQLLEQATNANMVRARLSITRLARVQTVFLALLALAIVAEVVFITTQVRIPLAAIVEQMRRQEPAEVSGAKELRFVSQTYNEILEENRRSHSQLTYEASHDPLTGLYNRSAYDLFMERADKDHLGLLIVDVDEFKSINDTYGHDVGDRVLKRVAEILTQSFRSVDAVCRLGGDEFIVAMTRANSSMGQLVVGKIAGANALLQHPRDGLPAVSLSVGVAFSDRPEPQGDLFKDADTALYQVKKAGRCGCAVFGVPYQPQNATD